MSPVTPAQVASLRARTGVSMMACKEALEEAAGDEEKAIEILRKRGIAQAAKKADRGQNEGRVFVVDAGNRAALVSIKCETDFVARDDNFQSIGKELAQTLHAAGHNQTKKLAEQKLPELVQKLGENITLGEAHLVDAPVLASYVHTTGKIGVIIGLETGTKEQAKDVALHAAALNPLYISPDEVAPELLTKEKEIWAEQLKKESKPAQIIEKIMLGKEKKFREEVSLLKQPFVKDSSKSVEQYLGGAKVVSYVRVAVG
jgi:elongation factor Ts